jgi:hypothetical protein
LSVAYTPHDNRWIFEPEKEGQSEVGEPNDGSLGGMVPHP